MKKAWDILFFIGATLSLMLILGAFAQNVKNNESDRIQRRFIERQRHKVQLYKELDHKAFLTKMDELMLEFEEFDKKHNSPKVNLRKIEI